MTSAREASSRHYLDELDLQAAGRHFRQAAHEAETGGDRLGDIARRELRDGWETMNGLMESRPWPGGRRARHAADFTEWDGVKKLVGDTVHKVAEQAPVGWRATTEALLDENPSFARLSDRELRDDARIHADFARRYGRYALRDPTLPLAAQDGKQAIRQVGMVGRDAFEVARRTVGDRTLLPVGRLVFGASRREGAELLGAAAIAGASAAAGIALLEHEVRAVRRCRAQRNKSSSRRQAGQV
ncbi:hypothetical protein BMF94_6515 [Rhodotorula taiwanensis]|uniref:Uncharacterized protein n=1 Tax=Rhodotorula taiwanensis TaxID=741276 RepID=A0A2S5B0Y6_9BASI|nr:hypothetical protein BMF94_6515 [Rhodotorula taiwanensis]